MKHLPLAHQSRSRHDEPVLVHDTTQLPAPVPKGPTVLVDFDGVLHRYSRGWHDGTVYDPPMPLAREAVADMLADGYDVVVFSTRDAEQIRPWLVEHHFPPLEVTGVKRAAVAIIDDRAIRHTDWSSSVRELRARYPIW